MNFNNLSPRAKKILLAVMAAGGLAVIVMFTRRNTAAAAAPDAAALGATPGYAVPGTTFADNGAQAGALSTDVTGALGDVANVLDQLPDLVGAAVRDNLADQPINQAPAGLTAADVGSLFTGFAAAFGPAAIAATPSGAPNSPATVAAKSTSSAAVHAAATTAASSQAASQSAANKAAASKPYTTTHETRHGVKGEVHHYPDHNVWVPSK